MYDDYYTTIEFVVEVLKQHFQMCYIKATSTMMQVHYQGWAVCGSYSKDIAETKVDHIISVARQSGYSLMCLVEQ